jgi:dihydroflavonol-4-reductase
MNILITGGTGFIGKHLLHRLSKTDHHIRCLVRKTSNIETIQNTVNTDITTGDILDRSSIKKALIDMDAIIHLANIYDFWIKRKRDFYDVNVQGTQNLMEEALTANIKKVIHISSLVAYGPMNGKEFNEESELDKYSGVSLYARTKYEGERIAWTLHQNKGLPLVVIHPGAVTGPGDVKTSGKYIQNMVNGKMPARVFTKSILSWVDVRDVAEIIVRALEKKNNIGERYFASAENLSFGKFNQIIAEKAGIKLPALTLPTPVVMMNARFLTFFSNIFKVPPMLDMSVDQMRAMSKGFQVDGTKAVRELGITYRPIEMSVEDMINAMDEQIISDNKEQDSLKEIHV